MSSFIKKKVLNDFPDIQEHASSTISTIMYFLITFSFVVSWYPSSYKTIFKKKNRKGLWLILFAGAIAGIANIISLPLFKRFDYSALKMYKAPLAILLSVFGAMIFLGERPNRNTYIALLFFLIGAYFSAQNIL